VFEILLERGAERDLRRLPESIHDRVIRAISALSRILDRQVAENLVEAKMTGGSGWATIV
jgi:hypothetical protein